MNLQFLSIGTRFDMVAALESFLALSFDFLLLIIGSFILKKKKTKTKNKKRTPDINGKEKK